MWDHLSLREAFFKFFIERQHTKIESSSILPPANDHSLLFVNSGMVQFKDYFINSDLPKYKRAISIQKCIRAGGKHNDIENVGFTKRHHTFFEMLGNFSFGDYGKSTAIDLIWEFLTSILKIPKNLLVVSIHNSDKESAEIWKKYVDETRIIVLEDNFWRMGNSGPCGPCSEIFYSLIGDNITSKDFYDDPENFLEIWNIVFMQFEEKDGKITPLSKPSIDTGGGLERILSVLQGKDNNFEVDVFADIIKEIKEKYLVVCKEESVHKIVADHIRTAAISISDGVLPDNEGRGSVLRKIIRRAIKFYSNYTFEPFLYKLVPVVARTFHNIYNIKVDLVQNVLKKEEEQFLHILKECPKLINGILEENNTISAEKIFFLHDSHGIPINVTLHYLKEHSIELSDDDYKELDKLVNKHKEKSVKQALDVPHFDFSFVGYDKSNCCTEVISLYDVDKNRIKFLSTIDKNFVEGYLITKDTPFYAESGGQVGDTGIAIGINFKMKVIDTQKVKLALGDVHLHKIVLETGVIWEGDEINLSIDTRRRRDISRNHSMVHLLGTVLEKLKGSCEQRGSFVNEKLGRLDVYIDDLSDNDISNIESEINNLIERSLESSILYVSIEEAERQGVKKLPGVAYPKIVRIINFQEECVELCGGTHVKNTSEIGVVIIRSISSIGRGIKRIEAIAGVTALNYLRNILNNITNILGCSLESAPNIIRDLTKKNISEKKTPILVKSLHELSEDIIFIIIEGESEKNSSSLLEKNSKNKKDCILFNESTNNIIIKSHGNNAKNLWDMLASKITLRGGGKESFMMGKIFEQVTSEKLIDIIRNTFS